MRAMLIAMAAALALATPASAQQRLSPEESALVERTMGPLVDSALGMCVSPDARDVAVMEARSVAAGWPAFEEMGRAPNTWRVSNVPPGDRVLVSFGMQTATVDGAPAPTMAFTCMFVVPNGVGDLLRTHVSAEFGGKTDGFFYLQDGALRELSLSEMIAAPFPQMFANVPDGARLVAVRTVEQREALVTNVAVFQPAQ